MRFKEEVRQNLTEIKIELAKNTQVLLDHHVRSSNLEARFKPIERHVIVVSSITKIVLSVLAGGAAIATIYSHFFK